MTKRNIRNYDDEFKNNAVSSQDFQKFLKWHKLVVSMSGSGNCYDNAAMESFFHTLKTNGYILKTTLVGIKRNKVFLNT